MRAHKVMMGLNAMLVHVVLAGCLSGMPVAVADIGEGDRRDEPGESFVFQVEAADGTALDCKLTLPERDGESQVPVVMYIHGASARTYDHRIPFRNSDGKREVRNYLDYYANELTQRGIALFRMSKRGCTNSDTGTGTSVDRAVFSKATISVMLGDYEAGLKALRERDEIDAQRIVLLGTSEGTRVAPLLAERSPDGIVGLALMAYMGDNARKTVEWQNTVGPWRNIQAICEPARDGELTKAEFDALVEVSPAYQQTIPFAMFDINNDDRVVDEEVRTVLRPRLQMIVNAVENKNDDFLWIYLLNLSSAYLLEYWDAESNCAIMLRLSDDLPIAIFHGTLDGACRVEAVHETEAAFNEAQRSNLEVFVYENADHDLGWTLSAFEDGGPKAFQDAFDWAARRLGVGEEKK